MSSPVRQYASMMEDMERYRTDKDIAVYYITFIVIDETASQYINGEPICTTECRINT